MPTVPVAVEHCRRLSCSWHHSPHVSHLEDVDRLCNRTFFFFFFLKIAFESAKLFPVLANNIVFFGIILDSGILLGKCSGGREARLGREGLGKV